MQFITKSEEYYNTEGFNYSYMGIGTDTYGTHYQGSTAYIENGISVPNGFEPGNSILYYYGEDENTAYVFAETPPQKQTGFGDPETFTVTWNSKDNTKLADETYFYGQTPVYKGEIPEIAGSAFSGWTPEIAPVTTDAVYTAVYKNKKFFNGHSLTLRGDIGIYFYVDVTAAGITPDDIKNGNNTIAFSFSWNTSPAPYSDLSKSDIVLSKDNYSELIDGNRFKIKCNTAAAEMTCIVHADARVKNASGTEVYTDTDDYSVYDYGMTIINNPGVYGEKLVKLAKAMLDYGAKSQVVFGINTGVPANKGITDYTMTEVTSKKLEEAIEAANGGRTASDMKQNTGSFGLEYYGSTMVFLTKTTLRHYYTVKDQSLYDSVKNNTTFTLDERKLPFVFFELTDIPANQLDTLQEFTIGKQTYYYSVLDYSVGVLNSAKADPANKQLAMAVYWYNYAANEYFG